MVLNNKYKNKNCVGELPFGTPSRASRAKMNPARHSTRHFSFLCFEKSTTKTGNCAAHKNRLIMRRHVHTTP